MIRENDLKSLEISSTLHQMYYIEQKVICVKGYLVGYLEKPEVV